MLIQEEYKIKDLVVEAYSYVVQFRPYQRAKKGKQVASSTKWGLGENVVLQLMECLTPTVSFDIFMNNYLTTFRLLTHLGDSNIQATGVLNKNSLLKCTAIGDKQLQKRKERGGFEQHSAHQAKKQCNLRGQLERRQGGIHSFF